LIKYTKILTGVCFLTTAFLLVSSSINFPSFLVFLGKISYSLYLIHLPIILIVGQMLHDYNLSKSFPNFSVVILLLSAIFGSILFYVFFEKPSISWAKKLKKE
jgi:peptidoglycan/LPS O-acetylase OafA/YrhL